MEENRTCETCIYGKKEKVLGNGITEPPYLLLVRCPDDNKYYKNMDDCCSKWSGTAITAN